MVRFHRLKLKCTEEHWCQRVLWLSCYLEGDDTDSHIDTLRFCDNELLLMCNVTIDDLHYQDLKAMEEELRVL